MFMELLKPKNDVVFHCLFRKGNENITKALISAIIGEEIEEIELDNDRYLLQEYPEQKMGILDLNAKLNNGVLCNIEIQLTDKGDIEKRILGYWARMYGSQLIVGEPYTQLNKAIMILIADFELESLKDIDKVHTKWQIREEKVVDKVLTEDLEIHIIMLPKARKGKEENELMQWLAFLDNPNKKGVKEMKKKNKDIADALWKLEEISEDKKLRRIAELKAKWELDEKSARYYWKEKGLAEGREEGKKQGIEEGIKEGIEKGEKNKTMEIAKKLLKKGIDIEVIIESTGLTKEEIEELKSSI